MRSLFTEEPIHACPLHRRTNPCVPSSQKNQSMAEERATTLKHWVTALLAIPGAEELPAVRDFIFKEPH